MPLSRYFKNHGKQTMDSMKETYKDPEKAKHVFYATAAKNKMRPGDANNSKPPKRKSFGQRIAERND